MCTIVSKSIVASLVACALLVLITCSDDEIASPKSGFAAVSGIVMRADNHGTIPKVTVSIGDRSYRTGSNGFYDLRSIALGEQVITAVKEGCYEPYSKTITITEDTTHDIFLLEIIP